MTKRILGLDLGTASIGWAYVKEGNTPEQSSIEKLGVRITSLTTDEQTNFEKGKPITTNADRTLKRGARKNLDRYQLRRKNLIEVLKTANIINSETPLAEVGENTTFSTWALRAKSVTERIEKAELARVLLAINKKRGYKSSRKAKNEDEGQAIDGMSIAKKLYEENLTPGQLAYQLLIAGNKQIPDFYRSDLQNEFDKVWEFQKQFYSQILTDEFYLSIKGKGLRATSTSFYAKYGFNTAENKGNKNEKKLQAYKWRSQAIREQLEKEEVAFVLADINNNLHNSSGYLGAISDRSKELYFNKQTVGQNLYQQLRENRHASLKNQVFYRQDYLDEFEKIWETQSRFHTELNDNLKKQIRDIVIFYQRKLKSQKGLISFCEFESKEIVVGKTKKTIGLRVAPKSSPLFQEFKIWQNLNNVLIRKKENNKRSVNTNGEKNQNPKDNLELRLDLESKKSLFEELNLKGNLNAKDIIELLGYKSSDWEINYSQLEGNQTNKSLYNAFLKILEIEGYDVKDYLKVKSNKDEVELDDLNVSAQEIKKMVHDIFESLQINTKILNFDAELDGLLYEQQPAYQLWHLLYSYEGDDSQSGNEKLYDLLREKFGFKREHSQILAQVPLLSDYGNLSTKAIRRIFPYIKENEYSEACNLACYRHSKHSLTKEELANRKLDEKLELLKKNSLRNPVVEKILNQMVNVVNTLLETNRMVDPNFRFDEIRIELARELKKNAKERAEMTTNINAAKIAHDKIHKILQNEFGIKNPTRNDIIRYRLYEELKGNGYKDLYTNKYIPRELLFSKQVDIEHIIPQSKLFDDSFSNKTVVYRQDNLDKGNKTAFDYISDKYGNIDEYEERIKSLYDLNKKNKEEGISKAKYLKLQKKEGEIGDGFIERDLRESQYIAKKAKEMLFKICHSVVSTSGSITDKLREDWDLINVMKELNLPKYRNLGLTEMQERKFGQKVEIIKDWTKRNDHRHHAMDALTVAFTKHNHIQYLNYLNARKNEKHKLHSNIIAIEEKETELRIDDEGKRKRVFKEPILNFRKVAKEHLENILISHKAKNKVVTKTRNKISGKAKPQDTLTPRGQLHNETIYGKYKYQQTKEEKISSKFDSDRIKMVSNPIYKKALIQRLEDNGNDSKKAFSGKNSLSLNPIFLDEMKTEKLPESVKLVWFEEGFSIRKDVTPENFKDEKSIEKVLDEGIKRILKKRLAEYGDPKKAFSDLDKNPIWLNQEKGISIKRVSISGVKNAEPLHFKKDHLGKNILDDNGNKIPADFINTSNNHHVAIYRAPALDKNGEQLFDEFDNPKYDLQENVVSFFEAVTRVNNGLPIIDKTFNNHLGWELLFTMKQNEMFVFPNEKTGFNPAEIDLTDPQNKILISPNLFRVQTISIVKYGNQTIRDFKFRQHLESLLYDDKTLQGIIFHQLKSLTPLRNIIKVRMNQLGDIVSVGEY